MSQLCYYCIKHANCHLKHQRNDRFFHLNAPIDMHILTATQQVQVTVLTNNNKITN